MPNIIICLPHNVRIDAELEMDSGLLRLSKEDRETVFRLSSEAAPAVSLDVDGVMLDGALVVSRLSQRIMLPESVLTQIQAIRAG